METLREETGMTAKKQTNEKETVMDYIKPSLILMIICLVVTAALVSTYQVTKPIIAEALEKRSQEARQEVLPEGKGFERILSSETESDKLEKGVIEAYQSENKVGWVITSQDKGYGGTIRIITGYDSGGMITNIKILEQSETPGLGTKVGEEFFLEQFRGKDSIEGVEAISGATISSEAMKRAVSWSLNQMEQIRKEGTE
jgi:electron transport complex protein RnfG